ncbi:MAG TPA: fumarylacetoacetase [Bacteroidia bacterium]|nr:fumarylacetoacetase [Bacteroidia bacterium]HRH09552.1 fumarylacetoacetase [Bacteroidia bacterium]
MSTTNTHLLKSWIPYNESCDFTIYNIPFGIIETSNGSTHLATIIGDSVIDLAVLHQLGYFEGYALQKAQVESRFLNEFIALGKQTTSAIRNRIIELFSEGNKQLSSNDAHCKQVLLKASDCKLLIPVKVNNYTDFYSSIEHATNVGTMFRDPKNALLPNWRHLPIGYHGRASSIVVSGTNFHRPKGQTKAADAELPEFGPCKMLDFELEMAFVVGKETQLGETIAIDSSNEYIFGMLLFNDWSARDMQTWEYVPLGPFLAKNFASTVSPWLVTMEALAPFKVPQPIQEPKVLPYLQSSETNNNIDIHLQVAIQPEKGAEKVVSNSNFKYMYWSMNQQLTHHASNGCNIQIGDMYASGTISGPTEDSYGSMLELTWRGTKPISMPDGSQRKFIMDGDTVKMRGYCSKDGIRVGFGEVCAKVLPATK